jgi:septum site-determining protein MinC
VGYWLGSLNGGDASGRTLLLQSGDRLLTLPELRTIAELLASRGLNLQTVEASDACSLVAAAALGLTTRLCPIPEPNSPTPESSEPEQQGAALTIHRGTLRSGDHLQVEGSVLLLGDVNPGARISAAGDVRVWGRLRGVAHAGCRGDGGARIVALQLRPLQLRIAEAVARGPEDQPPAGFCEEAVLLEGSISIRPAEPHWPSALNG